MMEHLLPGSVKVALAHLSAVGLAAIASADSSSAARFFWTDDQTPRLVLASDLNETALAEVVLAHARRAAAAESWVSLRETAGARAGAGLFTARAKPPADDAEWAAYGAARRTARASAPIKLLDARMIAGTGEPAWWRVETGGDRPDHGASRWEMKTRNQGQEFLVHRLSPLAAALSARSVAEIADGLFGRVVRDETGNQSATSRTATGLTTPGPVDSATAWCALWGLSAIPVIPRISLISRSPGMWPSNFLHPTRAALPIFTRPVSPGRFSQIMLTRQFDLVGAELGTVNDVEDEQAMTRRSAMSWLREQGVRALVGFPILKTGSASAPERQLLDGEVKVLT